MYRNSWERRRCGSVSAIGLVRERLFFGSDHIKLQPAVVLFASLPLFYNHSQRCYFRH